MGSHACVRTNRNHKQTYEFLVQACAFKHQKSRLSPVYPNDPSLVRNFTNCRDILRPYEIGIGAYSKVNIKYFKPLTYDSITKIA
jgi:hypothetical protein